MKAVGTKQLKNELSHYLQLVRQGETVLVLDRDTVVAEIRRPSSPMLRGADRWEVVLDELEAAGSLQRASDLEGGLDTLLGRRAPVPDASALIRDARDDRF